MPWIVLVLFMLGLFTHELYVKHWQPKHEEFVKKINEGNGP